MGLVKRLLGVGKKKKEDISQDPKAAAEKLRDMEHIFLRRQEHLESLIAKETATARSNARINNRLAMTALKRKKQLEAELTRVDSTLLNLEQQRSALENTTTNAHVIDVMKHSGRALKHANKQLNVDQVYKVMDDVVAQQDVANEIFDAIARPVGALENFFEDDLLKELEALEKEHIDERLLDVHTKPSTSALNLPSPPSTIEKRKEEEAEQDDLASISAWLDA